MIKYLNWSLFDSSSARTTPVTPPFVVPVHPILLSECISHLSKAEKKMCCNHNTAIKWLLWIIKGRILINTESDKEARGRKH